jgi:hypothetical protein
MQLQADVAWCKAIEAHVGFVWEMKDSSGWKRIEWDFGKF